LEALEERDQWIWRERLPLVFAAEYIYQSESIDFIEDNYLMIWFLQNSDSSVTKGISRSFHVDLINPCVVLESQVF